MTKKIAAVGIGDEMLAFSCVGVESLAVSDAEDAKRKILKIAEECAVIFVSEKLFCELNEFAGRFRGKVYPVLLPVAGMKGSDGSASRALDGAAEIVGVG